MTFREYRLEMKAASYRNVDRAYERALLAWNIHTVGSTNSKGKYKYTRFEQFFDYDEALKAVDKPQQKETLVSRLKEYYSRESNNE